MTYRTLGIVLRRRDVRETDRLYTIFTRGHGKIEALTRGSRKLASKLSPHLESFATVDLLIARGRAWDHVAGVETVERFPNIGSRFFAVLAASFAFEAADALTKPGLRDAGFWNLLLEYMRVLNQFPNGAPASRLQEVARAYICQLLLRLGVAPELEVCHLCKRNSEFQELSPSGVLCSRCAGLPRREPSFPLNLAAIAALRKYHRQPLFSFLNEHRLAASVAPRAVDFLLKAQLGAALKSEKMFSII